MKKMLAILELKKMPTDHLMAKFQFESIQVQEQVTVEDEGVLGKVTFQAGVLANKLIVYLLSVGSLKPRPNKTEVVT